MCPPPTLFSLSPKLDSLTRGLFICSRGSNESCDLPPEKVCVHLTSCPPCVKGCVDPSCELCSAGPFPGRLPSESLGLCSCSFLPASCLCPSGFHQYFSPVHLPSRIKFSFYCSCTAHGWNTCFTSVLELIVCMAALPMCSQA